MKPYLILAALLPFGAFAQPLNTMNNPNLPDYQIPSQQRMQTQMLNQQSQQKGMLNQQLQSQTRIQQQHLESQINNNSQRIIQSQPGEPTLPRQQPLPNSNGGMLNNSDASLNTQQHMLPQQTNGSMLNQNTGSTPQPNIPLKTISP
ncbi:DUF2756 family protein [Enterobacter sp. SA187]|uniref:DUF2756 family protein n=1 Tax=Enterobacter sp. SA187 TaxID=1914861 RepID=UPI0009340E8A|nr:DUF2756 family protein [Enterobacter sp. SA187]